MRNRIRWLLTLLIFTASPWVAWAQPTSQIIEFGGISTTLPDGPGQVVDMELWDSDVGGSMFFTEPHTVDVTGGVMTDSGAFDVQFGAPSGGLNPADFTAGSS